MKKHIIKLLTIAFIMSWTFPVNAYEVAGVDIHGFISQGFLRSNDYNYLSHKSKDGSFEYNEMGINFSKQLQDKLRIGVQLFARDVGNAGNNKITVDWAYADYRYRDWLGLRVGKIKLPMGLHNETRDMDMLRTPIVLPQGIYTDLLRDNLIATTGAGIYGHYELGGFGDLNYQLIAGVLPTESEGGVVKYLNDALVNYGGVISGDLDPDTSYAGALSWETPMEGLKVGYSYFHSPSKIPIIIAGIIPSTWEIKSVFHILSAEYTWNNLVMAVEYMERDTDTLTMGIADSSTTQSYYVSASYAFNELFTLGAYYSVLYMNKDDKDGNTLAIKNKAWEKDLALTLRFDINKYWAFKVEGHFVDGIANVLMGDNPANNFMESDWIYGAAKISFSF